MKITNLTSGEWDIIILNLQHSKTLFFKSRKIAVLIQQIEQKKSERKRSLNQSNIMKKEVALLEEQLESGQIISEHSEVEQTLIRLNDRAKRLNIVAPVSGIVQALSINSINAVSEPGKVMWRIVPMDDEIIVEARILSDDIGHVHIGQSAE